MTSPMELQRSISILLCTLIGLNIVCSSEAHRIHVGGREGWVENPKEDYNQWAGRVRFSVNDTLYFKYKKGDSVLLVSGDDYTKCNTNNPIKKLVDGSSDFTLDRSGPFFFVGGTEQSCKKGQRLHVVVLAIRQRPTPPVQPPTPTTSPSPHQAPSPASPTPLAPQPHGPSPTPSPSGPASPTPLAPHPQGPSPTSPQPHGPSPASPSPSPAAKSPSPPVPPPTSPVPPPSPPATPPTPSSPTPDHSPAPAPAPHSSARAVAPMTAWVLAATLLFSGLVFY